MGRLLELRWSLRRLGFQLQPGCMHLCGAPDVILALLFTHTTISVPALMGAIMCMGVATANSILVISFAKERFQETGDAVAAALEAGTTRFRPVVMTALAMMIGMIPMALGLGEGGEQNAPLGRAVIGGLIFSTFTTLAVLPAIYALLQRQASVASNSLNPMDPESRYYVQP